MSREIIFRVWHNDEMYYLHDRKGKIIIRNGGYVILEENFGMPFNDHHRGLDGAILMQHIGLQDRTGKDAYEGDIIEFVNTEGQIYRKEIIWDEKLCTICFGNISYEQLRESGYHQPSKIIFEIIGNIYETPKLLK